MHTQALCLPNVITSVSHRSSDCANLGGLLHRRAATVVAARPAVQNVVDCDDLPLGDLAIGSFVIESRRRLNSGKSLRYTFVSLVARNGYCATKDTKGNKGRFAALFGDNYHPTLCPRFCSSSHCLSGAK